MSQKDTLSWALGAMAIGFTALYFAEASSHGRLIDAESEAQITVTGCASHAAGPDGTTLLLTCSTEPTVPKIPARFESLVVRVGDTQRTCGLSEGAVQTCSSSQAPMIRSDAPKRTN
ncbi:MAG: hypothetical protein R3E66_19480 [bacterium]